MDEKIETRGRLAPSPTGQLHLGNAFAFILAWLLAKKDHGKIILRLEDLDPIRSKNIWIEGVYEDLRWLGLTWDEGPQQGGNFGPYQQSQRFHLYEKALKSLQDKGLIYPCYCTRKELRQIAGAPHVGDEGAPYPGLCRHLSLGQIQEKEKNGKKATWRLNLDLAARHLGFDGEKNLAIGFNDLHHGSCNFTMKDFGGDFALKRSDGVWAYQLAASVDDGTMNINQVVRGEDLLISTPRQIILLKLLGYGIPKYFHLPIVRDQQGERLAKRHASLALKTMRQAGTKAEEIIGLLAYQSGLYPVNKAQKPEELLANLKNFILTSPIILK